MADKKYIEKWCKQKVDEMKKMVVYDLSKDIEKTARLHFNRAVKEVPADDPYVVVKSYINGDSFKVECVGNQVLFIEFGAGITNSTRTSTVLTDSNNEQIEYASRPNGIYPIGHYQGRQQFKNASNWGLAMNLLHRHGLASRGMDTYWFYRSETGRGSTNAEQIRYNFNSNSYTMITIGIRPVRALYLAVGSGVRKITQRKK